MPISVRPLEPRDLDVVTRVLTGSWGGSTVMAVGRGEMVDAARLPGFVAHLGGDVAGVLTYADRGDAVEVITIDA
ncbi:MAG: GNAT family N-acetyltransferase, partial [Thermoactinospora sp.]|nr:GNAT family N-acetyltransferase [Thermoactinospora sp.]